MAMFYKNICRFDRCNLEFADLYDLIQHIEEQHIPADTEKKSDMPVACAPLSAICRYFQKLPDQPARPIAPEVTFQQPTSNIPSGAQAAAAMAAAAAAASVKKRIPSIIAQSSSTSPAASGIMTSGGQSVPQTPGTPTSILFHPPANVAARSSGATPASSHISDGDDESMSVGRESLSSESSMVHDDGGTEAGPLYKIVSPTGSSEERRFVCTAPGCKKSYKNMNGIRYHIKITHMNTGASEPQPNAKKFRCQCGKAYKTSHGLHNHMLQTHHRQAPVPSSNTISGPSMGNMNAPDGVNAKYAGGMAGVSATASQFKRGLPVSLMASGGNNAQGNMSAPGPKQQPQGPPSSLNSNYFPQNPSMKSSTGGPGSGSSTTTLPSGVSVQVSNLGGGAPTTVQVGQQGALGVTAGSAASGGPGGPGQSGPQGLHISAGRRLSAAHHMQQPMNSIGGRPLKIHSGMAAGGGIQGVVSQPSTPGVSAYNSGPTTVTTMGGGNDKID